MTNAAPGLFLSSKVAISESPVKECYKVTQYELYTVYLFAHDPTFHPILLTPWDKPPLAFFYSKFPSSVGNILNKEPSEKEHVDTVITGHAYGRLSSFRKAGKVDAQVGTTTVNMVFVKLSRKSDCKAFVPGGNSMAGVG